MARVSREEMSFNKVYWSDFAKPCKKCKKECKQSHKVTVLNCRGEAIKPETRGRKKKLA
jgi:hypothetical protein